MTTTPAQLISRIARPAALLLLAATALTLPNVGVTDVANPDAVYTRAEDEPCPDAADLTLDDVQVNDYGCDVTGLDALYSEEPTACYYSVVFTCDRSDGGGCNAQ